MLSNNQPIKDYDPELWKSLEGELNRQEEHIELIASENYTSKRVLEAQGSVLTNKYAEGYPGKRYYGGCEFVDIAESLAIERAKELFDADFANVQPHSGSSANLAVYMALCEPGDVILGMSLDHGGHLSHGTSVNFSGKTYKAFQYGLDKKTGDIDYQQVESLAKTNKPKLIIAGFSAYSGIVNWEKFRLIADEVGAYLFVDMAHIAGLVAVNLYPTPIPFADVVTTTTHKTLRGPRGGLILAKHNEEIQNQINSSIIPGSQGGPLMHAIAAKAVCFKEALEPEFKSYQVQVLKNANLMCNVFQERGIEIVSNGTKNHMFLVDLINKGITGKAVEETLGRANITLNKNAIPNDPQSRFITSGLRIGTPAITTRGFKEAEASMVASWICDILENLENEKEIDRVRNEVINLCNQFPVYLTKG